MTKHVSYVSMKILLNASQDLNSLIGVVEKYVEINADTKQKQQYMVVPDVNPNVFASHVQSGCTAENLKKYLNEYNHYENFDLFRKYLLKLKEGVGKSISQVVKENDVAQTEHFDSQLDKDAFDAKIVNLNDTLKYMQKSSPRIQALNEWDVEINFIDQILKELRNSLQNSKVKEMCQIYRQLLTEKITKIVHISTSQLMIENLATPSSAANINAFITDLELLTGLNSRLLQIH